MRAAVIGAGICGLAAARELAIAGWTVELYEAGRRIGGKLATGSAAAAGFDVGAESVLARRPEAVDLARDVGLAEDVVHPTAARSAIWLDGTAHPIPPSVQGVPGTVDAVADLLSPAGRERLAAERLLPAPPLDEDVPIGKFVARRCGDEVVDRLLEPMLGGVYAGRSRELSFAAVNPTLWAKVRTGGSLLGHAASLLPAPGAGPARPVFAGLRGGVRRLVERLGTDLAGRGVRIRTGATVRVMERVGSHWELVSGPVPAPQRDRFDAVVCAAPAGHAARLLGPVVPGAAELLEPIRYASMAVVTLVVRPRPPGLTGSGLLVPPGQLPTVKALTHSSRKWQWVAEASERRWGAGVDVVRASVGRLGEEHLLQVDDAALVDRTFAELAGRLPAWAGADLVAAEVTRWGGGLPQYAVGHVERVAELRDLVARAGRLAVCGAYLDGVGIAACVASAQRAARTIIDG